MAMNIRNNSCTNSFGVLLEKYPEKFRPLSKKEEQDIIKKYRNDPDKARKILVQHNIRVVFSLAKKYSSTSMDFDEMIGRGFEGLCYAAKKFDLNRGIKFITYAVPWVFKFIMKEYSDDDVMASRVGIPLLKTVSSSSSEDQGMYFENIVQGYLEPSWRPPDTTLSSDELISRNEVENVYSDVINHIQTSNDFDSLDKIIFQRNLVERDSMKEISTDLNIQCNQMSKRKKDLVQKLRTYLKDKWGITSFEEI